MQIDMAPTGKLIHGDVLDVNKRQFERTLKDYDKQLYVEWNPRKRRGWGCWEIRRHSNSKSLIPTFAKLDGTPIEGRTLEVPGHIWLYEHYETDVVNHVLDCTLPNGQTFLDYRALEQIKEMDTWNHQGGTRQWIRDFEAQEVKDREQAQERAKEDMKYRFKYNKTALRDWKAMVEDGYNPFDFFAGYYGDNDDN